MSALVETMFYVGKVPWHGGGEAWKLDRPATSEEAMVASRLNWMVGTRPLYMVGNPDLPEDAAGQSFIHVPDGQAVLRLSDNKVLGVVGPRWTPVQNVDAFNFFDPLVQEGLAIYHTAGSLKGGRIVWILAQIGNVKTVIGDDGVGQFLLLSMGHDGTRAVQLMPTPVRVVCANTLNLAERNADGAHTMVKVHHTVNAVDRLDQIGEFLMPYLTSFDETTEVFKLLAQSAVNRAEVDVYLKALFPDPKRTAENPDPNTAFAERVRDTILAKFEGDLLGYAAIPSQFRNTYWTLYNAVVEYVDHERGSDKNRAASMWTGSGALLKKQAFELATVAVK